MCVCVCVWIDHERHRDSLEPYTDFQSLGRGSCQIHVRFVIQETRCGDHEANVQAEAGRRFALNHSQKTHCKFWKSETSDITLPFSKSFSWG